METKLNEILAADGSVPEWVMIACAGRWLGAPQRPEIITEEHLRSAADYFERNQAAHGADLVVDYHHATLAAAAGQGRAPAAGWIREMDLRNAGRELWGHVLWVSNTASEIAKGAYRYLSPVLRWNTPDRVTGAPVPMMVHSVALTNTPFLTELESLNEAAATDGGADITAVERGGESMKVLALIAAALTGMTPEQVASALGLEADAEDAQVAQGIMALVDRVTELEAASAEAAAAGEAVNAPVLPDFVCNALGLGAGSGETAVNAALMKLQAGVDLSGQRAALGLAEDADEGAIITAINDLQLVRRKSDAEELVDGAVEGGKITPAAREFWLANAGRDLEAARQAINSMQVLVAPSALARKPADKGGDGLTVAEKLICKQMGLKAEEYLAARA